MNAILDSRNPFTNDAEFASLPAFFSGEDAKVQRPNLIAG